MTPFSSHLSSQFVETVRGRLFVRHADMDAPDAPSVVLLHGHTQTSDMWAPLANRLAEQGRTVFAVDLPGLGRSAPMPDTYDKSLVADAICETARAIVGANACFDVMGHDLGAFVAFAMAHQVPGNVNALVLMDAIPPGIGIWNEMLQLPMTWHFGFWGDYAERMVRGRERIYLDRFWDEFAFAPGAMTQTMRRHYTSFYQRPGAIKAALSYFESFERDASTNIGFATKPLPMPLLGLGGAHSLGETMADQMSLMGLDASAQTIQAAGHWLMEENPSQTMDAITTFLSPRKDGDQ